ncbi:MAG: cytochrome b/b6 domain-containing protein [Deltaproteobacteria bacterium]|nr:cytochrome b/b6 domain-containing protein [Deltaproteobacteria bacterium]
MHWINAMLVITMVLLILGKEGMEIIGVEKSLRVPVKRLHAYIGHIFIITFMLRIIWGFMGNAYARWSDMIPYKKENWAAIRTNIKWYLSGFKGRPAHIIGHDPLASLFYIALFIVLIGQALTGLLLSGLEFKTFPGVLITGGLGEASAKGLKHAIGGVHEFGMLFILFFLAAHLTGLAVHELKEKTGLFSSMIHGKKYFPKE